MATAPSSCCPMGRARRPGSVPGRRAGRRCRRAAWWWCRRTLPYETWGFVRDLTQVLGQVSISAAALSVISRQAR
ncbi:hypothetical protein ACFQU7_17180 [Pseudoroseomonas wenyumeiae]